MRRLAIVGGALAACDRAPAPAPASEAAPPWAYVVRPKDLKRAPVDDGPLHVPDSTVALTAAQINSPFLASDWHPDDHPPMPAIVAVGRAPEVSACGYCHRADGPGGPENASLAGLPAEYMTRQLADMASGARHSAVDGRLPSTAMTAVAKAVRADEIAEAVAYYAALTPRATLRVVETDTVPEIAPAGWFLAETRSGRTEPTGHRLLEVPEDVTAFERRDARARFVVYAPPGSVARGKEIAEHGLAGKVLACVTCHGPGLRGVASVPRLAGRSPSYLVRQLWDIQHSARTGAIVAPMAAAIQGLDLDGIVAVTAYAASLAP